MQEANLVLIGMTFMLGFTHGLDLDHLAIIDSLTRAANQDNYWPRIIGVLFSLGHGLVVTLLSILLGSKIFSSHTPEWLNYTGSLISIFFLLLLAGINLIKFWRQLRHKIPIKNSLTRLGSWIIGRQKIQPWAVIFLGAIFALSFDTFSQVAVFALSSALISGVLFSAALGLTFMCGMILADGLNGWVIAKLMRQAAQKSPRMIQVTALLSAGFNLLIAGIGIANMVNLHA